MTGTSSNATSVLIESSTSSGEPLAISDAIYERNISADEDNNQHNFMYASIKSDVNTYWPNSTSRTLALISCTLGLFNISRFAILTINYGVNFFIQFLVISFVFGIPFLWLQMSLGSKIKAGPISMWKISPICIGIGISITLVQYLITIYSSVTVLWILIIIQDIFFYKSSYLWSEFMHDKVSRQSFFNYINLTESIPEYLNVNVLRKSNANGIRLYINHHLTFYLILLWAVVFVILCKGLKSFGRIILLLGTLPLVLLAVVAVKLLCVIDLANLQNAFCLSEFDDFLTNSKTWVAAAQEAFFTWSILGASVLGISSRTHKKPCKQSLRNDAILVVLVTLVGLCLSALIGICFIQIINESGYVYVPGFYERRKPYSAISSPNVTGRDFVYYSTKFLPHYSTLIGEVYTRHIDSKNVSGYQVLRFITELLPAAVFVSNEKISMIWTLIMFIAFFLFGLSQLCVMWKPFSYILGTSPRAVLISCVLGLTLSYPFTTEIGNTLVYYTDYFLGGAWFIPVLWSAEIFGIFLIRGRPYNSDDLVNDLQMSSSFSAYIALSWNIFLPIGLIILAVIKYKITLSNQLFYSGEKSYSINLAKKAGDLTQIGFLILIPISAIAQICLYLTTGPPDILDRIQMLYRPLDEAEGILTNNEINSSSSTRYYESNQNTTIKQSQDDAPPKYSPPPSYTTATGARLIKMLRQSLRRSVRHILGELEMPRTENSNQNGTVSEQMSSATNLTTIFTGGEIKISVCEATDFKNEPCPNLLYCRSLSLGRKEILNKSRLKQLNKCSAPTQSHHKELNFNAGSFHKQINRPFTAADVRTFLRSSTLGRGRVSRSVHLKSKGSLTSLKYYTQNV